jgi:hypothetical protein
MFELTLFYRFASLPTSPLPPDDERFIRFPLDVGDGDGIVRPMIPEAAREVRGSPTS